MKHKQIMIAIAAAAAALTLAACDKSQEVVEKYLQAKLDGDVITMTKLTKNPNHGKKIIFMDKQKNGNEVIYSYKIEEQDGSVLPGNGALKLVIYQDKITGAWLVNPDRSVEEMSKKKNEAK